MPDSSSQQRRAAKRGTSQPWLFAAVLLAVVVALGGGLLARNWYEQPTKVTRHAQPPKSSSPPSSGRPGSPTVGLSGDASDHPHSRAVRSTLQRYFDAINKGDYDQWLSAVTPDRAEEKTRLRWQHEYRSTKDGDIMVYRIERAGSGRLRVLLRFVSMQDSQDAPPDFAHHCIRWRVVFPLTLQSGAWKLDSGQTSASPQHDRC